MFRRAVVRTLSATSSPWPQRVLALPSSAPTTASGAVSTSSSTAPSSSTSPSPGLRSFSRCTRVGSLGESITDKIRIYTSSQNAWSALYTRFLLADISSRRPGHPDDFPQPSIISEEKREVIFQCVVRCDSCDNV